MKPIPVHISKHDETNSAGQERGHRHQEEIVDRDRRRKGKGLSGHHECLQNRKAHHVSILDSDTTRTLR